MRKHMKWAIPVLILLFLLFGLRLYGAYQNERDGAIARADAADRQAATINAEVSRLQSRADCNLLWMKYQNAQLEKRIAELRGSFAPTPIEPQCSGYATSSTDLLMQGLNESMQALSLTSLAMYERKYAGNRKYQTEYIGLRLWGFLTGTEPKMKQAEFALDQENAANLRSCLASAKSDDKKADGCRKTFGSVQH
jgi:hypothetical protein